MFSIEKNFEQLINDLQILETVEEEFLAHETGFIKGSMFVICGDNLGSHQIGGYLESFIKTEYFCADIVKLLIINFIVTTMSKWEYLKIIRKILKVKVHHHILRNFFLKFVDLNLFHLLIS